MTQKYSMAVEFPPHFDGSRGKPRNLVHTRYGAH